jgi:uncharacterized protein YcbX
VRKNTEDHEQEIGAVEALWRYPVKSMLGEALEDIELTHQGLSGDRAYALVDAADGKVASAKHPRKWSGLFGFRASLPESSRRDAKLPVVISLPSGDRTTSEHRDVNKILSEAIGRGVMLRPAAHREQSLRYEYDRPDMEGIKHKGELTDMTMPDGTFFDAASIHLLTTAALERLRELYPQGRLEVQRFRPNIVLGLGPEEKGFVEDGWLGRTLCIGDEARVRITAPCPRCVMVNLPQEDLPKDPEVLRTIVRHNGGNLGVFAAVLRSGRIRRGDPVRLV